MRGSAEEVGEPRDGGGCRRYGRRFPPGWLFGHDVASWEAAGDRPAGRVRLLRRRMPHGEGKLSSESIHDYYSWRYPIELSHLKKERRSSKFASMHGHLA